MGIIAPESVLTDQTGKPALTACQMRLRHGLSEHRRWNEDTSPREVSARIHQAAAQIVRLAVDDDCSDSESWQHLEDYLTAVLAAGAIPMITFSRFGRPYSDSLAIDWFARCAASLVRRSSDRWGPETVREWFWCLGDQPNSDWINGGLTFDLYRLIYEAAAEAVSEILSPDLGSQKAMIGGPGIDGFQPFWMDWVYRFVNEIDNRLISFVVWHRYGDWRQPGEWGSPKDESTFRALLMSRSGEYETRSRAVNRMLKGRGILNICGELNAHSDHHAAIGGALNRTEFGAAYYASSLIHLMRGGADAEMLCSVGSGITPQHLAKQLCARFVRSGDDLVFHNVPNAHGRADMVVATSDDGNISVFLVHCGDRPFTFSCQDITLLARCQRMHKIDRETNGKIVETDFDQTLQMNGYGVAVLTSREGGCR